MTGDTGMKLREGWDNTSLLVVYAVIPVPGHISAVYYAGEESYAHALDGMGEGS